KHGSNLCESTSQSEHTGPESLGVNDCVVSASRRSDTHIRHPELHVGDTELDGPVLWPVYPWLSRNFGADRKRERGFPSRFPSLSMLPGRCGMRMRRLPPISQRPIARNRRL